MSGIIFNQTVIMLILMLVGVLCNKTGIISSSANRELSKFVLQIVNPVMIFMSYQTEIHDNLVKNLLVAFLLSIGTFAVMITLIYLFIPAKDGRETEIERFSAIYSNCGFMGIPLANAMFGNEGVFYLTAFITVFNLAVWTHGIIMLTGERDMKKVLKVFYSPTVISIVLGLITFFLQIKLPALPSKALQYIADLNTPMAMIVSGISMAETNVLKMLKKSGVYRVCALKLIILPVLLSLALSFLPVDQKVRLTVIVAFAAPPAAMCTLQCLSHGKNYLYASEIFTAGTLLSIVTLPLIVELTEYLTKISR